VKHFCPIEAQNLTSPHTSVGLKTNAIARKVGTIGGWRYLEREAKADLACK
jgi:hypothetical protein